jgi:sulfur-carrier protein adenylyltransferase/sulfurtransferase
MKPRTDRNESDNLSTQERQRYARHLILPEIGEKGQIALKNARVLIVGLGGLGSPASLYLTAAGIGSLGLVDADRVDVSNLQRQPMYHTNDIGRLKTDAATDQLICINPHTRVISHTEKLTSHNALEIMTSYDLIVDCTDNFVTHYLINDACILSNKMLVYGNVDRFEGQVGVVRPKHGPCYRCLYPVPPPPELAPPCAEAGVLNTIPGLVGLLQATEVLKLILGCGESSANKILRIDGLKTEFRTILVNRDPTCPVCSSNPTITSLVTEQIVDPCSLVPSISVDDLNILLKSGRMPLLLDVRNPAEYQLSHIHGSRLIPFPLLLTKLDEFDVSDEIIVYCQSGTRSAKAATILHAQGYTRVRHLVGGMTAYGAAANRRKTIHLNE